MKCNWNFRIIHNVREILSLQDAYRTADGNWQEKSISDMKHSLLLMHRGHVSFKKIVYLNAYCFKYIIVVEYSLCLIGLFFIAYLLIILIIL